MVGSADYEVGRLTVSNVSGASCEPVEPKQGLNSPRGPKGNRKQSSSQKRRTFAPRISTRKHTLTV
jgi:hypothetical protein